MLVPGFGAGRDIPGAQLVPDPNTEYKVVFDLEVTDDNLDDPYPFLPAIATYVNTLGKFGVPAENRKIAVVLHRGSGLIGPHRVGPMQVHNYLRNSCTNWPRLDLI